MSTILAIDQRTSATKALMFEPDNLDKRQQIYTDYEPAMDAALAGDYYSGWQAAVQRAL